MSRRGAVSPRTPVPPKRVATAVEDGATAAAEPPVRARRSVPWHRIGLVLFALALLVIPAAVAGWISAQQPVRYAIETSLLHQPDPESTVDTVERELATHQVLLRDRPLVRETAAAAGRSAKSLAEDLSVEVVEGSSVLRVQVVDTDPDRGRATLADLVDRYQDSEAGRVAARDIGRLRALSPPLVLDEPAGPTPLQAAAAGLLVGLLLVVVLLALLRVLRARRERGEAP